MSSDIREHIPSVYGSDLGKMVTLQNNSNVLMALQYFHNQQGRDYDFLIMLLNESVTNIIT